MFCPHGTMACSLMLRPSPDPAGTTGSYSVSESHFFTPIRLHSGLVWTAEAPAEATPGQRKKEQWVSLEPWPSPLEASLSSDTSYRKVE